MKRQLTGLLVLSVLVLSTAGCSAAGREVSMEGPGERVEEKLEAAEGKIKREIRAMTEPAPEDGASVPESAITKEEAQWIALEHLGLTADQVKHLRTDYEIDDGVSQYDVEFHYGDWEYEFEIHAATGKILGFDKNNKYN